MGARQGIESGPGPHPKSPLWEAQPPLFCGAPRWSIGGTLRKHHPKNSRRELPLTRSNNNNGGEGFTEIFERLQTVARGVLRSRSLIFQSQRRPAQINFPASRNVELIQMLG